ncbi:MULTISPECIES: zinc ribbon domain-containing protein [Olivibacter]|uniref:Zinc ribbon domain-containing protein n=1 Tax=Olivibacter jilunii TaxID=985016 RepID=A0ABW6AWV4_9SPHI
MMPTIPDNVYKILVAIGLFIVGYSQIQSDKLDEKFAVTNSEYSKYLDSLHEESRKADDMKDELLYESDILSTRNGVKNPIKETDSLLLFTRVISKNKNETAVSDSLAPKFRVYKRVNKHLGASLKDHEFKKKFFELERQSRDIRKDIYLYLQFIGLSVALIGFIQLLYIQMTNDRKLMYEVRNTIGPIRCQSCARRFTAVRPKGKNKDGSYNQNFCMDCYTEGEFTEPNLTFKEVYTRTKNGLSISYRILFSAYLYFIIKNLDRWSGRNKY